MFVAFGIVLVICLCVYVYTFYTEKKIFRSKDTVCHPAPRFLYVIAAVLIVVPLIWSIIRSLNTLNPRFFILFGIINICFAVVFLLHNRMRYYVSSTGIEEFKFFSKPVIYAYSDIHTYALCSHGKNKFICLYTNDIRLQIYYINDEFAENLVSRLEANGITRLEMPFLVRQEEERLLSMHSVKEEVRKVEINAVKFSVIVGFIIFVFLGIGLFVTSGMSFIEYKNNPKISVRYDGVSYENGIKINTPSGIYSVRKDLIGSFDKESFENVKKGSGITLLISENEILSVSQGNKEYLPLSEAERKSTTALAFGCVGGGVLLSVGVIILLLGFRYIKILKKGNKDVSILSEKSLRWCDEIKVFPKEENIEKTE